MNIMNKWLMKSPFITATLGGVAAIVVDALWLVGELLTHFEILSQSAYVFWRFGVLIGLAVSVAIACYGIHLYIRNGYVRADREVHKEHLLEQQQDEKRNNIFKS